MISKNSPFYKAVRIEAQCADALAKQIFQDFRQDYPAEVQCANGLPKLSAVSSIDELFSHVEECGFLSSNGKTVVSLDAPFTHCRPSASCPDFCYAARNATTRPNIYLKQIKVAQCISIDPIRSARIILKEWQKLTEKGKANKTLRIFGSGDFDNNGKYLAVIRYLNKNGVRCHVFSKKPEILKKVSADNVRLLSVDASNIGDITRGNRLPVAVVYTLGMVKDATFRRLMKAGRIQCILPVQGKGQDDADAVAEILHDFPQAFPLLCPCDSGLDDITVCGQCDADCGRGCYHGQATACQEKVVNFVGLINSEVSKFIKAQEATA